MMFTEDCEVIRVDTRTIMAMQSSIEDYRRLAVRLTDAAGDIRIRVQQAGCSEDSKVRSYIDRIENQAAELRSVAASIEEILRNYSRMERELSSIAGPSADSSYGGEFGMSVFDSLEEHENLMPIHP